MAERMLFCARDHVGAKPFYYCLTAKQCVFASDINGVLAIPGVSHQLNETYVALYLQDWAFPHHELTFFDTIRKLPPAHTLTVRENACGLERYWCPDRLPDIRLSSETAYVEAFLDIYTKAVEARLRSIHPVGTHVSGGLDSSSITVLAARALKQQGKSLQGFCWEPPPQGAVSAPDERGLIQAVCAQEDLPVHYLSLTEADCRAILQRDVTREPTLDTLMYEEQVQRQAAAHQIRVLLSGWGGDEFMTFNGRGYYAQLMRQGRWRILHRELQATGYNVRKLFVTEALMPLAPAWCQNLVAHFRPHWVHRSPFHSYIHPAFAQRMRRQVKTLAPQPLRMVGVRPTQLWLLHLGHLTQRIEDWAANAARSPAPSLWRAARGLPAAIMGWPSSGAGLEKGRRWLAAARLGGEGYHDGERLKTKRLAEPLALAAGLPPAGWLCRPQRLAPAPSLWRAACGLPAAIMGWPGSGAGLKRAFILPILPQRLAPAPSLWRAARGPPAGIMG